MRVSYSGHAEASLLDRELDREWVERTLRWPEVVEPDPKHPERLRGFRAIPERDGTGAARGICTARRPLSRDHGLLRSRPEAMKTRYDPEVDALYVRFAEAKIVESEEVRPGVVLDFDAEGRIVGMEILDASEHLARGADLRALSAA
jgi:uncharacterized protein YuzE